MTTTTTIALAFFATSAVLACAEQTRTSTPTARTPVAGSEPPVGVVEAQNEADRRVVDRIATARCDHEEQCDRVGQGKKYATRDVCQTQLHSDTMKDLNAQSCPKGIDQSAVDHCLGAIQAQPCSSLLGTLTQMTDCRVGSMCMK
jgi:hypothetical protein